MDAFHHGVNRAFTVARSHYEEEIDLDTLSTGYSTEWTGAELADMTDALERLSHRLADILAYGALPTRS